MAQQPVTDGVDLHYKHLRAGEARSLASISPPLTDVIAASTVLSVRRETDRSVADLLPPASRRIRVNRTRSWRRSLQPFLGWRWLWHRLDAPRSSGDTACGCRDALPNRWLAAVLTVLARTAAPPSFASTVIASELPTGPGAMWAEGARMLALRGAVSLRMDLVELGGGLESPPGNGAVAPYRQGGRRFKRTDRESALMAPRGRAATRRRRAGASCFFRAAR